MQTKICKNCKEVFPITDFHYSQSGSKKRKPNCKICVAAYFLDYKARNADKLQGKWRQASKRYNTTERLRLRTLKKYNLTLDEYNKILDSQDGVCAICLRGIRLCVDHNHKTGFVRGIICHFCNLGLGYFEDDIKRMKKAIKYIAGNSTGN